MDREHTTVILSLNADTVLFFSRLNKTKTSHVLLAREVGNGSMLSIYIQGFHKDGRNLSI